MSFQPSKTEKLETLFINNQFIIPQYQRRYSWQTEQRTALFNDIEENFQRKHFIGMLCFQKIKRKSRGVIDVYEVIDGQQRLTTLFICELKVNENS